MYRKLGFENNVKLNPQIFHRNIWLINAMYTGHINGTETEVNRTILNELRLEKKSIGTKLK